MENDLNVKTIPAMRAIDESRPILSNGFLCEESFIRHGGLVRMGMETERYSHRPYHCPCCSIVFISCSPHADSTDRLNLTNPLWHLGLELYLRLVGFHGIPEEDRPCSCPKCKQNTRKPHRHSHFSRTVLELSCHERILIFRFRCPICFYVHSIIPAFLEPYQQMTLDLQEELMDAIELGETRAAVAAMTDELPEEEARTDKTISRIYQKWLRRLRQLSEGLWSWLLTRTPYLELPRSSSLWTSLRTCWDHASHRLLDFKRIRFLHGLNRLCLSLAVTEHR